MTLDPYSLPPDLPVPEDDGAARHLPGVRVPALALPATTGEDVALAELEGWSVVFAYPRTGRPGGEMPGGEEAWNAIPGARGCTPELCGVRDDHGALDALGARVFGLSTQDTEYQLEVATRLGLQYPLLSDEALRLTQALDLPTFETEGLTLLKRLTLLIRDGEIAAVAYPVFPPDGAARQAHALLNELGLMPDRPLVFLTVIALLTISPGADMAVVGRSTLAGGRRAALATTLGVLAGCAVWAVASAIGVAALLEASRVAYDALRFVGAAYLVWLGVQSLMAARRGDYRRPVEAGGPTSTSSAFRQGFLTNLFNPKIAVFYSTFLPQFIGPGDPVLLLSLGLAGVHILMGLVWLSAYAWALDHAANRFRSSRVRRALDAVTGTVLVALGLRLAAERR